VTTTEQPPPNRPGELVLDIVGRKGPEPGCRDPGVEANARLTAATGLVLLVMLAAEGFTLVSIGSLLSWHIAIGLALIPPVTLKLSSTMWRFAHYYLGDRRYTASGPPHLMLRVLGPLLILSTVALLGTGVGLWLDGAGSRFGFLHKASFVVWVGLMTIHVLAHVLRGARLAKADLGPRAARLAAAGNPLLRQGTVLASAGAGLALALVVKANSSGLANWTHHHRHLLPH